VFFFVREALVTTVPCAGDVVKVGVLVGNIPRREWEARKSRYGEPLRSSSPLGAGERSESVCGLDVWCIWNKFWRCQVGHFRDLEEYQRVIQNVQAVVTGHARTTFCRYFDMRVLILTYCASACAPRFRAKPLAVLSKREILDIQPGRSLL